MATERAALPPGVPPLRTLYVYLTGGCNLACRHCWLTPSFHPDGGTGGHLAYELFERAIDEAIPLGLQGVKLTGGEPFLHPEILRLVELLKERKIGLTIETNGTLVTPELAQALRERSTLGHISVSIDGSRAEIHDPFRGVAGSFDCAVDGVRALVAAGYRPQVIMSLHSGNARDIESTVRLAERLGASSVKFNLVQQAGRGVALNASSARLGIGELISVGKWIETQLQKSVGVALSFSWPVAFYGIRRLVAEGSSSCGVHTILGVLPTGEIALCGIGELVSELCFGRLGVDSLGDVWTESPKLLALRRTIPWGLEGVCRACLFLETCAGHCAALTYCRTGRLTAAYWFCEEAEKIGLFPEARLVGARHHEEQKEVGQ